MSSRPWGSVVAMLIVAALPIIALAGPLAMYIPDEQTIAVPENYQTEFVQIGAWSIADPEGAGAAGIHNVYTQPETVDHFKEFGEFPHGAVVVKELRTAETSTLTTGTASWGTSIEGWFVMVKDRHGTVSDDALWGDGWGWAFFPADSPSKTTTKDYRNECVACHTPAQDTDWIYLDGYPVLKGK